MGTNLTAQQLEIMGLIPDGKGGYRVKPKERKVPFPEFIEEMKSISQYYNTSILKEKTPVELTQEDRFDFNSIAIKHTLEIDTCAAPRMTQRDTWKKRPATTKYWAFKDKLRELCSECNYTLTGELRILFIIPMPVSWSKKKQFSMNHTPHRQTPDIDNFLKGFFDAMVSQDNYVWNVHAIKIWGYKGKIIIF